MPAGEFERAIDAAFRKLAREVRVPGFRPGKAPRKLLEARLGTDIAREQALRDSLPEFYVDAVNEHDVDVIAPPEIAITAGQEAGDVEFDCHHAARALGQKPGHRAAPRADFDHQVIGADRDRLGDAPAVARVGEEMLAELGPAPELGLETVGHGTTS